MNFLQDTYIGNIIMTLFISMVPVIELRGAIPIAVGHGLDLGFAIFLSIIGNMIPVPFIIIFIRRIFKWMRTKSKKLEKLVSYFEKKADKHKDKVTKYGFWGLFILVAIPLPGTGAWTGALVAAMMDIRLKTAIPAILLGVITAGIIVALVSSGVFAMFTL